MFAAVYLKVTPFDELALIRDGNAAATLSFGGALIGFPDARVQHRAQFRSAKS